MAKQVLDLYMLYKLVTEKGGLVEVINKKIWREITKGLNLPTSITSAAFTLRTQYMKYLYPYECEKRGLSSPAELQAAIDSNRREGRRQSYGAALFNYSPVSPPSLLAPPKVHLPHLSLTSHTSAHLSQMTSIKKDPKKTYTRTEQTGQNPSPVQLVSGPVQLVPGLVQLVPSPVQLVPGPVQLVSGPVQLVPGLVQLVPSPVQLVPGPVQLVPGPVQLVPGPVQLVPGPVQLASIEPLSSCLPGPGAHSHSHHMGVVQAAALESLREKLELTEPPEKKMMMEEHRLMQQALQRNLLAMATQLPLNISLSNTDDRQGAALNLSTHGISSINMSIEINGLVYTGLLFARQSTHGEGPKHSGGPHTQGKSSPALHAHLNHLSSSSSSSSLHGHRGSSP
uniref:AT-rich interactive domain-containing protein 3 n=1 Tax=Knipowitschia caucasica TaxID=637954 RepID=A0AAV2MT68_KNICA